MSEKFLKIEEVTVNGNAVDPGTLVASQALSEYLEPAAQFLMDNYRSSEWLLETLEEVVASAVIAEFYEGVKPAPVELEGPARVRPTSLSQLFGSGEEGVDEPGPNPAVDDTVVCEGEGQPCPERDPYDDLYLAIEMLALAEKFGTAASRRESPGFRKDLLDTADVLRFDAMELVNPGAACVVDNKED